MIVSKEEEVNNKDKVPLNFKILEKLKDVEEFRAHRNKEIQLGKWIREKIMMD